MSIPTSGPSAHRLRDLLGAPRDQVAYHHDPQFHATVELVCQLLDVVDNVTDADTARRITDEFAALLTSEHTTQAHQRLQAVEEGLAASLLAPRPRRLSPAAEVMTGYHGPRDITPKHTPMDCPNAPHGCRVCTPVHDITVHNHPHDHEQFGVSHRHPHRHPQPRMMAVPPAVITDEAEWHEAIGRGLGDLPHEILPSGTFEAVPYQDWQQAVTENLGSLNELVAELTARESDDIEFSRMARDILRRHSWSLGMQFQGEMGDPDGPVSAAEPAERDAGSAEHPEGPGT